MKQVLAVFIIFFLLHCEWHNSFSLELIGDCSGTSCCSQNPGTGESDIPEDTDTNPADTYKKCCTSCCCFIPAQMSSINAYSRMEQIAYAPYLFSESTFTADCFHPPELI